MATGTISFRKGDEQCLSELRLVLLGVRGTGKSSAGNTILGTEEFNTEESTLVCLKRHNEVAGRQVTVVDTLGWRRNEPVKDTTELFKQKIVDSVSLCPPGPHAFLLVIDVVNPFTEELRRSNEEHLELFSETVWRHTIVLFTSGDQLRDMTIEEHIAKEGKALQWLVGRCGNRFHVLNSNVDDGSQVTKLLGKIEQMVAGNGGCHYEMDSEMFKELEEKRKVVNERAIGRQMKVMKQRGKGRLMLHNFLKRHRMLGETQHLSELRIVLLGWRGTGKSSTGNTILGKEVFKTGEKCVKEQGEVSGRQVTVLDTQGWLYGYLPFLSPLEKDLIVRNVCMCSPGPHALIILIPVTLSFREEHKVSIVKHMEHLSDRVWRHVLVLFGGKDKLKDVSIEHHIESEEMALQWLIEKCENRYHVLNNLDRSDGTQVTELLEKIEEMVAGNNGRHYEMDSKVLKQVEEKTKAAEERMMKVQNQRETLRMLVEPCHLSELRIVLLGHKGVGKSTTGNAILGSEAFETGSVTVQGLRKQAVVAGRKVTMVDTPGFTEISSELEKLIILENVYLCSPGPHVFLLIIPSLMEYKDFLILRPIMEEKLNLLTENVWRYTMVLFTLGEKLGNITIEQHIENSGKALQRLVEKCGNRYHVLNSERGDGTQVTELLEKIEEMVAGNSGHHYEMDSKLLKQMDEWWVKKESQMKVQNQKETGQAFVKDKVNRQSELRIVLLGWREGGKSSAANIILGREEFASGRRTAPSVKRHGKVAGQQITVVDTPGFPWGYDIQATPELIKKEIVRSMSLCPPGPHALLLVIPVFFILHEQEMRTMAEHLALLGERVWKHTILLFTYGDMLANATIQQYVEWEGKNMQFLVDKCGNRYHMFNNMDRGDHTQVTGLLEKIEDMVAENDGNHYEMDSKIVRQMKKKYEAAKRRSEERMLRETPRAGVVNCLSELRIVLLGCSGAEKSMAGNIILGTEAFETGGGTPKCVKKQGEVAGRQVTVVDTPGWDRGNPVIFTHEMTKAEIEHSFFLCPPGPHAFLLVINITSSFTEREKRAVEEHFELFSEHVWKHVIVLFTGGDWLGDLPIEQYIECEGKAVQHIVGKCGNRYHALNKKGADASQVTELLEKISMMVAGNNGCHFEMDTKLLQEVEDKLRIEEKRVDEMEMQTKREAHRTSVEEDLHLSELRMVLLGWGGIGRSSVGNIILGAESFGDERRTLKCVKREGEVTGRRIILVNTPGWNQSPPQLIKEEVMRSVSLCTPGPHAFLLVINTKYTKVNVLSQSMEGLMNLFGEKVWSHTVVLFSVDNLLGSAGIVHHSDKEIQCLMDKCGNRHHVLNRMKISDGTQVDELLKKVEEMVAGNGGLHYEMDSNFLLEERITMMERPREEPTVHSFGEASHLSELRILLLGFLKTGKSSAGNTILSREKFDTVKSTMKCVGGQGQIAGRKVTVVDTLGWFQNQTLQYPSGFKKEILDSIALCSPGPHALLLVIDSSVSFTENYRRSLEEHFKLFTESVWRHTIILFTRGEWLGDTPVERYIGSEGEALQWLVEKCGNRYHVFYDGSISDRAGVPELLEKIERMVAVNGGLPYEMDSNVFHQMDEKEIAIEKKVKQRHIREKAILFAKKLTTPSTERKHITEMRIVLLGAIRTGKSSAGNTILGRQALSVKLGMTECVKRQGEANNRQITVIDTPGWLSNTSQDKVEQEIIRSMSLCPPGPHAVLLVISLLTPFTENDRRSVEKYMETVSHMVWRHTIVLFTWGDHLVDSTIQHHIEREGKALQWIVEKCGHRYQVFNNMDRGDRAQVNKLMEKIERMVEGSNGKFFSTTEKEDKKAMIRINEIETREVVNLMDDQPKIKFQEDWNKEELWRDIQSPPTSMSGSSSASSEDGCSDSSFRQVQKQSLEKVSEWLRKNSEHDESICYLSE